MADSRHISVLIPVYNGARYVAAAIESILAQTHPHFELLILDDGSTDATPEILASYAARDPRIRLHRHPNCDQPRTLNRGLELVRHDWVAILDHDDVSLPMRLERQLAALAREPDARVIGSHAAFIIFTFPFFIPLFLFSFPSFSLYPFFFCKFSNSA